VALVDAGVEPLEAVDLIRKRRRGAFNKNQLEWIMDSKGGLKRAKAGGKPGGGGGGFGGIFRKGSTDSTISSSSNSSGLRKEKSKGMLASLFGKK
jgi:protein tyrosine phosphatase type 4A